MEQTNQKSQCQQLWARNKYLVLSHSSNIYKDIRQYLKQEVVELSQVQEMIDRACQIPEHRGQVCNAFQHIWAILKSKPTLTSAKTICSCWIATALVRLLRKTWSLRLETCLIAIQIPTCNIRLYWKETPMRLWHEALISQLPPSSALGATSRVLRPSWQWLGQKACDGWLCFYPFALLSLCLSSLDHGGDG